MIIAHAVHKYARISCKKAIHVTRVIQGRSAEEALHLLRFIPKKSARMLYKVLASAIANAMDLHQLPAQNLIIHEAAAESASSFRRYNPGPRGQAMPIRKHTCHLRVALRVA
jgi:large subunit ribosomal protein L22